MSLSRFPAAGSRLSALCIAPPRKESRSYARQSRHRQPRRNRPARVARLPRAGHQDRRRAFDRRSQPQARRHGRRVGLHRAGAGSRKLPQHAAIIAAAEVTDATAIHPGYGFLSENADFAERVAAVAVSSSSDQLRAMIRLMGDKVAGDRGNEGSRRAVRSRLRRPAAATMRPRMRASRATSVIRSSSRPRRGGGGRGMRVVHNEARSGRCRVELTQAEAEAAFGNAAGLHREVPRKSAPRRDPDPRRQSRQRDLIWASATARCSAATRSSSRKRRRPESTRRAARAIGQRSASKPAVRIGYRGAGTVEFLVDKTANSTSSK